MPKKQFASMKHEHDFLDIYYVFHILPQIYTANHATFPIQMYAITVYIFGNFWGTQYCSRVPIPLFKSSIRQIVES